MNECQRTRRHDQTAVWFLSEIAHVVLDLAGVAHVNGARLHPKGLRHSLNSAKLACSAGVGRIAKHRRSSHFPLMSYSKFVNPVAFPPGRARLLTKPPPTASATWTNTMGTVRVACCKGPTCEPPAVKMTSGARAINSAAYLRMSSASPAVDR